MKTLTAGLTIRVTSTEQRPILAVEIAGWGGSTFRYNTSGADVTFGGNVYADRPLRVGVVQVDSAGQPIELSLSIANEDLALSDQIATAQPIGATVTLRRIFLDDLTVSQILASALTIQNHSRTEHWAEFRCLGVGALLRKQIPRRTFSRTCAWEFKSTECGYLGAAVFCSETDPTNGPHEYTDAACISLNNWTNFGGFLFVLEGDA